MTASAANGRTETETGAGRDGDADQVAPDDFEDVGEAGSADPDGSGDASSDERFRQLDNQLHRSLADLDNVRKRFQREVVRERSAERTRVAATWLPVVDDLERALQHAGADPDAIVEGVRTVFQNALLVLAQLGYPRTDDIGQPFDPSRHEAAGAIDSDLPRGTVVAVSRAGYGEGDHVLRPASVVVSRGQD